MISSRVRHNKTHRNGHHDVHARQGKYRQNKRQENFLPRRDSRPSGASRASQMQSIDPCTPRLTLGSKILTKFSHSNTNEERERGTGVSTPSSRAELRVAASFSSIGFAKGTLQLDSTERTRTQQAAGLRCPPVHQKQGNAGITDRADRQPVRTTDLDLAKSLW